jgi:hypothetical protein
VPRPGSDQRCFRCSPLVGSDCGTITSASPKSSLDATAHFHRRSHRTPGKLHCAAQRDVRRSTNIAIARHGECATRSISRTPGHCFDFANDLSTYTRWCSVQKSRSYGFASCKTVELNEDQQCLRQKQKSRDFGSARISQGIRYTRAAHTRASPTMARPELDQISVLKCIAAHRRGVPGLIVFIGYPS